VSQLEIGSIALSCSIYDWALGRSKHAMIPSCKQGVRERGILQSHARFQSLIVFNVEYLHLTPIDQILCQQLTRILLPYLSPEHVGYIRFPSSVCLSTCKCIRRFARDSLALSLSGTHVKISAGNAEFIITTRYMDLSPRCGQYMYYTPALFFQIT